jgi:hypothetical protein
LLPHLRSLLLSDNQIAEWVPTRASLKCLGELTELSLSGMVSSRLRLVEWSITIVLSASGNPLASDADYKMLLLSDCSSLVSLDAAPVRSYLREQVCDLYQHKHDTILNNFFIFRRRSKWPQTSSQWQPLPVRCRPNI